MQTNISNNQSNSGSSIQGSNSIQGSIQNNQGNIGQGIQGNITIQGSQGIVLQKMPIK